MRNLAPFLAVAALLCLAPFIPAPVGPENAIALDDPAFPDGGCRVLFTDAGTTVTVDTFRPQAWQMAIQCLTQSVRYKMCEASTGTDPATCAAGVINQRLAADLTYDIAVPSNRRWLSITSDDAGTTINCCVQTVTPRNLPESL